MTGTISISASQALPEWVQSTEEELAELMRGGSVFKDGETLQLGWMWFRFKEVEGALCLQAPMQGKMPFSWNSDCSHGLNAVMVQKYLSESFGLGLSACDACQSALILKNLDRRDGLFMNRLGAAENMGSGWFVGSQRGDADVNDPANLDRKSLWEITCLFPETLMFWMLPPGWQVVFSDVPVVLRNYSPMKAIPGSFYATKFTPRSS